MTTGSGQCSSTTTTCPPTCTAGFTGGCPQDDPRQTCRCYQYEQWEQDILGVEPEECYCCPVGTEWDPGYAIKCNDIDQCANGQHGCSGFEVCVNHAQGTNICTHGCFDLWEGFDFPFYDMGMRPGMLTNVKIKIDYVFLIK